MISLPPSLSFFVKPQHGVVTCGKKGEGEASDKNKIASFHIQSICYRPKGGWVGGEIKKRHTHTQNKISTLRKTTSSCLPSDLGVLLPAQDSTKFTNVMSSPEPLAQAGPQRISGGYKRGPWSALESCVCASACMYASSHTDIHPICKIQR